MKITCVQSLAPGAQQSSTISYPNTDIVNLDDDDSTSTNESGVVFVNSIESLQNDDPNSRDDQCSPSSPDPRENLSEPTCGIYDDDTQSFSPIIIPMGSAQPMNVQSFQSPITIEVSESPTSPDDIQVLEPGVNPNTIEVLVSPASPDAVEVVETPLSPDAAEVLETPLSPDAAEVLETPLSPDAVEVVETPLSPDADEVVETPLSPDAVEVVETPLSPDAVEVVETPLSPDAVEVVETPLSPDAVEVAETPLSPDAVEIVETPLSPDAVEIVETPLSPDAVKVVETPFSPDAVEILEDPLSPDAIEVLETPQFPSSSTSHNPRNNTMKIRFEFQDDSSGMVPFSLDKEGDGSFGSSKNDNKTDTTSERQSSFSGTAPVGVFGQGMCDDWNRRREEVQPLYSVDTTSVLDNQQPRASKDVTKKPAESQLPSASTRSCFNCTGDHTLSKCPHRHNAKLIATRRRDYFNNRGGALEKDVRYHQSHAKSTYGYDSYKPGVISDNLRSALGYASNAVPGYIYRMRQYGYPPGSNSQSRSNMLEKLKKGLVEYPGFTSPMPVGYRDDGARFGVPFNEKYTIDSLANQWYRQQSFNENRNFLTAKRTPGLHGPIESDTQDFLQFPPRPVQFDGQPLNTEKTWYDDLMPSTPSRRHITSDMQEVERIYQNVIKKKVENPGLDWTDLQYQGLVKGNGNYRVTEEIERREEEARKVMAAKKKAGEYVNKKRHQRESNELRSKSPSLLDETIPMDFSTTYPSNTANELCTTDDGSSLKGEKEITQKTGKRPQKRPLESETEVITIGSDDEDKREEKKIELLPNPLFKRPRLGEGVKENTVKTTCVSKKKCDMNCKMSSLSGETWSWNEEHGLDHVEKKKHDASFEPIPPIYLPSAGQEGVKSSFFQDTEINKHDLLDVLAKNSEQQDLLIFTNLPPMANFSKGMAELPLQEEAIEFSGRLTKVLNIIHIKKKEMEEEIQIIE